MIYTPKDCYDDMKHDLIHGKVKGTTTYSLKLDLAWTWRMQEYNIFTGYSNQGKGQFIKQLCLIKALEENAKFVFSSPEDFPPGEFFDDMIHTLSGMSTDIDRHENYIPEDLYDYCFDLIKDKFVFVYLDPAKNTIEANLDIFKKIISKNKIESFIIDPILKFKRAPDAPERDDRYAQHIGTLLGDFARVHDTSVIMVMHQKTPNMMDDRKYPKPNMYNVKGGGSWVDGCDNLLYIERPNFSLDKLDDSCIFGSQKIKKMKLTGTPQDINLRFDRKKNRYLNPDGTFLFDFDKFLKEYEHKKS